MSGIENSSTQSTRSGETYTHPAQVVADQRLSHDEKVRILREWYYDAVRLQDAASENMTGPGGDRLQAVSNALLELGETPSESKHGSSSSLRDRLSRNLSRLFGLRGH
jgi:hypothetical protein